MRILIISNKSGAMIDFRLELIKKLQEKHDVVIATPFDDKMDALRETGVSLVETAIDRRGTNPLTDLSLFFTYYRIIKKYNPDLIITYTIKPNIYAGIAARLSRKEYVANITGLGSAFEKSGVVNKLVVFLYRIALKRAKRVFFENCGDRDVLIKSGCCTIEQSHVLNGAGVNIEKFPYLPYPNNEVFRFLFIGRVMAEKGIVELFSAMRRLISAQYLCCLDVVGPMEDQFQIPFSLFEKEKWLRYYGYQEDVRPFIKECDCFVLPSYHEGMANTNLECASSGRPLITCDIPGCREAVVEGSGILCLPKSVDSLFQAMKEMMDRSREEREQMGEKGRDHMKSVFDKRKVVEETISLL